MSVLYGKNRLDLNNHCGPHRRGGGEAWATSRSRVVAFSPGHCEEQPLLDHEEIRRALAGVHQTGVLVYVIRDESEGAQRDYPFERVEEMRVEIEIVIDRVVCRNAIKGLIIRWREKLLVGACPSA